MKNPWELLKQKERELVETQKHIVALKIAVALLREEGDAWPEHEPSSKTDQTKAGWP